MSTRYELAKRFAAPALVLLALGCHKDAPRDEPLDVGIVSQSGGSAVVNTGGQPSVAGSSGATMDAGLADAATALDGATRPPTQVPGPASGPGPGPGPGGVLPPGSTQPVRPDAGDRAIMCGTNTCVAPTWEELARLDMLSGGEPVPIPEGAPEPQACCDGDACGVRIGTDPNNPCRTTAEPDPRCGYVWPVWRIDPQIWGMAGCCDEQGLCGLNLGIFGIEECFPLAGDSTTIDAGGPPWSCVERDGGPPLWEPPIPAVRPASDCPMPCPDCEAFFPTPYGEPCCKPDDTCGCTPVLLPICI